MQETTLIEQDQPVPAISALPGPNSDHDAVLLHTNLAREELPQVATPPAAATHKTIPHIAVVKKLIEAFAFRQIGVVREEFAVSSDAIRMFRRDEPELRLRRLLVHHRLAEQS